MFQHFYRFFMLIPADTFAHGPHDIAPSAQHTLNVFNLISKLFRMSYLCPRKANITDEKRRQKKLLPNENKKLHSAKGRYEIVRRKYTNFSIRMFLCYFRSVVFSSSSCAFFLSVRVRLMYYSRHRQQCSRQNFEPKRSDLMYPSIELVF